MTLETVFRKLAYAVPNRFKYCLWSSK